MINNNNNSNEQLSSAAFTKQSEIFDQLYSGNTIIKYKRERVREHIQLYLAPQSRILELNAGTGEDAVYFGSQSHKVHATDLSEGMLKELKKKINEKHLEENISTEQCSFTDLENLKDKGPYNYIFSNFAGLNCTDKLDDVLRSLKPLLEPHGYLTMVILPPFCLWETLLLFKGKFKTAFRRFNGGKGVEAHIEGVFFKCWYYKPSFVIENLKNDFDFVHLEGLCTIVPPSYIENFAEKYPRMFKFLVRLEKKLKTRWPWKYIGDYYIITFRKKT